MSVSGSSATAFPEAVSGRSLSSSISLSFPISVSWTAHSTGGSEGWLASPKKVAAATTRLTATKARATSARVAKDLGEASSRSPDSTGFSEFFCTFLLHPELFDSERHEPLSGRVTSLKLGQHFLHYTAIGPDLDCTICHRNKERGDELRKDLFPAPMS